MCPYSIKYVQYCGTEYCTVLAESEIPPRGATASIPRPHIATDSVPRNALKHLFHHLSSQQQKQNGVFKIKSTPTPRSNPREHESPPAHNQPSIRRHPFFSPSSQYKPQHKRMERQTVDTIIDGAWVLPIAPDERTALPRTSIVITEGRIQNILPTTEVDTRYEARVRLNRTNSILMPGFINAHTHAAMTLMRGRANDLPLHTWLQEHIWPMESKFANREDFIRDGVSLAISEMIRSGTTCFSDMYYEPEIAAEMVSRTGMRAILGIPIVAFPTPYAQTSAQYIEKGHAAWRAHEQNDLITFSYAPHAPYSVDTSQWKEVGALSLENGLRVHTHLHETEDECNASRKQDRKNPACHLSKAACRPMEDLDKIGLVNDRFVAAHMVHLTPGEIQLAARKKMHVVSCPISNAMLGSGICKAHELITAGVNLALGTDSACSNNNLDMCAEMKYMMLQTKASHHGQSPNKLTPSMVLRMATWNGAKAFGIENRTGSLEIGKQADIISVDIGTRAGNTPVFDPHAAIVYAGSSQDVRDVIVAGKFLLQNRQYRTLDLQNVLQKARYWQEEILKEFPM